MVLSSAAFAHTRKAPGPRGLEIIVMAISKMPAAGDSAPDFELPDSDAILRQLSELVRERPIVLLFYRGAW
jgi:hypothetical protein